MNDYVPAPDDLAWARTIAGATREGGIIAFPATHLIYRISHSYQTLTLLNPEILSHKESAVLHRRTITVFAAIDYLVLVKESS